MNQKKSDQDDSPNTTGFSGRSITELAVMLSQSEDVDDALFFEHLIAKMVIDSNVAEIAELFLSKDRYCNIAGLRILSDYGRTGLANIYRYIDPLFDRDDLILRRLCLSLIEQHNYYQAVANKRMAQFVEFPDEPIRKSIRVWLLWRTTEELEEFVSTYKPFENETKQLLDLLMLFRLKKLSSDQFLKRVSAVDDIAFRNYTSLSQARYRGTRVLFHGR